MRLIEETEIEGEASGTSGGSEHLAALVGGEDNASAGRVRLAKPLREGHLIIPALRTDDGPIGWLRRFGGILLGDAVMTAPLPICGDRDADELRRLARRERGGRVSSR